MATAAHGSPATLPERRERLSRLVVSEMWGALSIGVMWLAVLFDAIFGPDFVSSSGSSTTRIPSSIVVALFAFLATRAVARYAFGRGPGEG